MIQLDRKQQLVILLLAGIILFGAGYRFAQVKEEAAVKDRPVLEAAGESSIGELSVHVAGAVAKPGVYSLPLGARVIDAVNKAVPLAEADLESLKLASKVTDGQDIYVFLKPVVNQDGSVTGEGQGTQFAPATVPGTIRTSPLPGNSPSAATAGGLVNINTADQNQLDTLPGIGPALAQRIIQYREINGPYQSIEDIKNVSGIGEKSFEKLKDKITVR